jgi:hypothetical protein
MPVRMSSCFEDRRSVTMAFSQPQAVSLTRVLGSLEEEVASLARMSDDIQDTLSNVLSAAPLTTTDLVSVQNLDLVAQHLGAIATYVRHLSAQVSEEWAVRPELAAAMINLSGLAQRLSMRPPEEAANESDDAILF